MTERRIKGWHVLAATLGFFAVVIGVNAAFITLALATFSGEVADEPYVQGLAFNETLAARALQAERGWTASLDVARAADGTARFTLEVRDVHDAPVSGLAVTGVLGRPATAALDREFMFVEQDGAYVAVARGVAEGDWELTARTAFFDGAPFEAHKRLWLR